MIERFKGVVRVAGYFRPMPGNTFGQLFRLTTFGESHGAAIGGVVDGCPARLDRPDVVQSRPMTLLVGTQAALVISAWI